jgi:hypothetical protein
MLSLMVAAHPGRPRRETAAMMPDPRSISDRLAAAGYGHRARANYKHDIFEISTGRVVGVMSAYETITWVKAGCPLIDGRAA